MKRSGRTTAPASIVLRTSVWWSEEWPPAKFCFVLSQDVNEANGPTRSALSRGEQIGAGIRSLVDRHRAKLLGGSVVRDRSVVTCVAR